jgi:peptidylglycine monooxygenase
MLTLAVITTLFVAHASCLAQAKKLPLFMPHVHLDDQNSYLCKTLKLTPHKTLYVTGFEPDATANLHHMVVVGCSKPQKTLTHWVCGRTTSEFDSKETNDNPCTEVPTIIYAWSPNAEPLKLPKNVGFQIGKGTRIHYLVLQIHYSETNKNDTSGLNVVYTERPRSKLAGVLLLASEGTIPPRTVTRMEILCQIKENKTIHPFAYRVHTHHLGKDVSGYVIRRDDSGTDRWTLLGRQDPRTPQAFRPVLDENSIRYKDRLAARCTMDSTNKTDSTIVGPDHENEMCNFYLMYYVERTKPLDVKFCISRGPPHFYWRNKLNHLNNIPDEVASIRD